jgi:hypothetical protein
MAKSNYAMQTAGAFLPLLKTSRYKARMAVAALAIAPFCWAYH